MRKSILFALACLLMASCSNPSKMAKLADQVQAYAVCESGTGNDAQVLEVIGGKITPTYTLKFPAEFFLSEAILNVTPVIVYDGGCLGRCLSPCR